MAGSASATLENAQSVVEIIRTSIDQSSKTIAEAVKTIKDRRVRDITVGDDETEQNTKVRDISSQSCD